MAEVEMDGSGLDGMMEAMKEDRKKDMCRGEEKEIVKVEVEGGRLSGSVKRKGWKCTGRVVGQKGWYGWTPC